MFTFFTLIFLAALQCAAVGWQCFFCYYPYNSNSYLNPNRYLYPQRYPYPYPYPLPYPYPYPIPFPNPFQPIAPTTSAPSFQPIGPCVNGQCPAGYGCFNSQCIRISNIYGSCNSNQQCSMGFCYNGQCVG